MTTLTLNEALENIYRSLSNDNENLDAYIAALKTVLQAQNTKSVEVNPSKLAMNNRQGRKMMQSYFKQRGVEVTFAQSA